MQKNCPSIPKTRMDGFFRILQLFSLLPIPVMLYLSMDSSDSASRDALIRCLLNNHSQPSHPIAPAIFTSDNPSFSSILQSHIRNLRFHNSYTRKPYLIITPLHVSHVQSTVLCAQNHNLLMKIRSGGHDYEGVSYRADVPFFILDMFNLRAIHVDVDTETAWVQTGTDVGTKRWLSLE